MSMAPWCIVLAGWQATHLQMLHDHLAPILAQALPPPRLHMATTPAHLASDWPKPWVLLLGEGDSASVQAWREGLQQRHWGYQVLYGQGADLMVQASHALARHERLKGLPGLQARPEQTPRWRGPCERCADPACEHRLFSQLKGLG
ncbi:MAG: hypothetical protein EBQ82_02845 [Betaproteobacteria bacterium]|nr:hypothetical protein [Betaproteobacteria bacterium]